MDWWNVLKMSKSEGKHFRGFKKTLKKTWDGNLSVKSRNEKGKNMKVIIIDSITGNEIKLIMSKTPKHKGIYKKVMKNIKDNFMAKHSMDLDELYG